LEAHQPATALKPRQLAVGRDGRRRVGDHIPRHVQPDGERLPVEFRLERFQSRLDGRLAALFDLLHFHKHGHHHLQRACHARCAWDGQVAVQLHGRVEQLALLLGELELQRAGRLLRPECAYKRAYRQ
jgi:hypothetical protein